MFNYTKKTIIGILVIGMLSATVAHAHTYQTYIIHTYGNPSLAQVVQNELSPMHGGNGGSATFYQDKLIIRATPTDYARILPLIQQIDTTPTPLTISVSTINQTTNQNSGGYINGGITPHQSMWINGEYYNSANQDIRNSHYSVRTQSGSPTKISTDTLIGLPTYHVGQNRHQLWVNFGTSWVTLSDGFSATPHLLPNGQINLNINTNTHNISSLSSSKAVTTITLPRGQWVKIGEIRTNNQSVSSYNQNSHSQIMPIWVRID